VLKRTWIALVLGLKLVTASTWGEVVTQAVEPAATGALVQQVSGPHQAWWDDEIPGNGLLLISLGGTASRPQDLEALDREAVRLGYRALAIDYPNQVISTACRESKQPNAFDRFRSEIVEGRAESDLVEVNPPNSIEGRIQALLVTLAAGPQSPIWKPFLERDRPAWNQIVVVGHSQGSGHAAYLGKLHSLRGVILLGGPQDQGAAWLTRAGQTEPERYLSFLHRDDFFKSSLQIETGRALMANPRAPLSEVEGALPGARSQIVVTSMKVRDPHMSLLDPLFRAIWRDLLGRSLSIGSPNF
jgi:pimeloyl-ACP methyl ester carboxylesterase